jgi:hypothetical protein
VRPGIAATATYGPSGKITELAISPVNTTLIKSRNTTLSAFGHALLPTLAN